MKQFKKQSTFKSVCAFILAFMLIITNITGLIEVKAAGVESPTINKVFFGATTISGGNLHRAKIGGKVIRGTVYVTLKNKNGEIKDEVSVTPTSGSTWKVNLSENVEIAEGDTVTVYQQYSKFSSQEVTVNAEPSLAYNHKNDLKMPSGDFYLEQYVANIVNDDEKAEALQILKDANPTIADEIASINFVVRGEDERKTAYYTITYTDGSVSKEISAPDLNIIGVTEYSRGYTLEPYNVVSTVIKGKLEGEGPFNNIVVQFSSKLSEAAKKNFCEKGSCTIDKDSSDFKTIDVNPQTGEFSIDVGENTLQLGEFLGIVVKEKHKFATCAQSVTEIAQPEKVGVKDPKRITEEDKKAIAKAVREANTTASGKSKLPDGNEYTGGIPAVIQIDDSGNVKIFSGSDVAGTWDWDNGGIFVPEKNKDGSYKLKDEAKLSTSFNKPEEFLSNLAPDAPTVENKDGNVVITPNIEVDTDAKKVIVEFKGENGYSKTIVAEKTDNGWTVNDSNAKVDKNGVVTIPTKDIKPGTTITASVEDNGGLVPEETVLDSGKTELLIKGSYKVSYNAGEGTGKMAEKGVEAGEEYTILESRFTVPTNKEFDYWQVGSEKKNTGDKIIINSDTEITAIYKYIIEPTLNPITTKVNHPINYNMYKAAINKESLPSALTIEHIEVKTKPDISKVGKTESKIEVRFSDGQFRTLTVEINVIKDPKDTTIEELNNKVTELNTTIDGLNTSIIEKDTKIAELNDKITELEKQLKTCQEQCAANKAQCEKDKAALQKQIDILTTSKTALKEQAKKDAQTIEELRKQIADLQNQVTNLNNTIDEKDSKIKELEDSIKDLNTKLETANNKNTELTKQLETANQKIKDLESQIETLKTENKALNDKVTELEGKIANKDAEIKTLNETITILNKKVSTLETEKAKDKEVYEKDKAVLQEKLDKANQDLTTKNSELDNVKKELEQVKKDLADEKDKNTGITENTKAQEAKIADLEEQLKGLQDKLDKANTNLKDANDKIAELEKQVTEKEAENKTLKDKVAELNDKIKEKDAEINTLTGKVTELEKEITEKTNQEAKDKDEIDKLTKDLGEVKKQLEEKNTEVENLNKEVKTLKDNITTLEGEKTELTNKVTELEENVKDLKDKIDTTNNKVAELEKENSELKESNKDLNKKVGDLGEEVGKLKEAKDNLEKLLEKSEEDKTKLQDEKKKLEKDLSELKEDLSKCPADQPEKIKDLETKITEKENLIKEKDKDISNKDKIIKELKEKLNYANNKTEELNKKLKDLESKSKTNDNDYIDIKEKYERNQYESYRLEKDYWNLRKENRELLDEIDFLRDKVYKLEKNKNNSCNFEKLREKYVTIFNINNFLYQSYIGDEFITQAEMNDSKGYISPFISNGRTMLPMRYVALSLGFDVYWNNHTRTATFVNTGLKNNLDPGRITINADNLNMLNQYGQIINVDSRPILRNGRFYVSISNIVRAFNGTQGYTDDEISNTIEWDPISREVLVYKYIK